MEKVKITLVVPERIAVLVQNYVQRELLGDRAYNFAEYLRSHKVAGPMQYLPEMEIGIEHPDDVEQLSISNHSEQENIDVFTWLKIQDDIASYFDFVTNQNVYSVMCLNEINIDPPQYVIEFIASVKATDCSYFRFVNS